jgi:uncharacterized protein (TIRG00374 family)
VNKKRLHQALSIGKLLLGVTLLAMLLLWDDNAQRLWALIRSIRLKWIFALLVLGMGLNWISCLKWRIFLTERGFTVSMPRLLGLYLVGKFFSNFMPSMIGGDLTRTYLLGRQINSQSQSFASVFMERFTGLVALILLAIFFSLLNPDLLGEPKIGIAIVVISVTFIVGIVVLLNQGFVDWAGKKFGFIPFATVFFGSIRKVQQDILYFQHKYKVLSIGMAYSFGFHFMASINVYLCCVAINIYPSFMDIAVITPVILLLNIVPVSPNNIGWWEWTFSFLLVEAGTGTAEGLAVGLILRAMTMAFSLIGGALFLFEKMSGKEGAVNCR